MRTAVGTSDEGPDDKATAAHLEDIASLHIAETVAPQTPASAATSEAPRPVLATGAAAGPERTSTALGPAVAQRYECPQCSRWAPWTDGRRIDAGDEVDEYWCQTCGAESPLSACRPWFTSLRDQVAVGIHMAAYFAPKPPGQPSSEYRDADSALEVFADWLRSDEAYRAVFSAMRRADVGRTERTTAAVNALADLIDPRPGRSDAGDGRSTTRMSEQEYVPGVSTGEASEAAPDQSADGETTTGDDSGEATTAADVAVEDKAHDDAETGA